MNEKYTLVFADGGEMDITCDIREIDHWASWMGAVFYYPAELVS